MGQQADPPHDLGQFRGRDPQLVLEALWQQLPVVGELPLDEPRGEDRSSEDEHDLVALDRDAYLLVLRVHRNPCELLQRARGNIHLEGPFKRSVERRLLDAQPVGVRRHHR